MHYWSPITVSTDLAEGTAASGVYLTDGKTETVLSVSEDLTKALSETGGRALGALEVSVDKADYETLILRGEFILNGLPQLREFEMPSTPKLIVFSFEKPNPSRLGLKTHKFTQTLPKVGEVVELCSTPFGLSHINLFHGYRSTGTACTYTGENGSLLVDARYLDGMNGGICTLKNGQTVGLIAGVLNHRRKRGSFVVVVPWHTIGKHFNITQLTETVKSQEWMGVVAIKVREGPRLSWGSGVLVGPNTVVTNHHVVRNKPVDSIEVCFSSHKNGERMVYGVKSVKRRDVRLDLVQLELDATPDPKQFPSVPVSRGSPIAGEPVKSVGFGLILPERILPLAPLQSNGIVNRVVEDMLIVSSSCWNGSSGGAVFNKTGELVGIMASNATDNQSQESMPDVAFAIPVRAITSGGSELAEKLFKLERTHRDSKL